MNALKRPRWSSEELEVFHDNYPHCSNQELATILGRSPRSVASKAYTMYLRKSAHRLRRMGRENVSIRYVHRTPTKVGR